MVPPAIGTQISLGLSSTGIFSQHFCYPRTPMWQERGRIHHPAQREWPTCEPSNRRAPKKWLVRARRAQALAPGSFWVLWSQSHMGSGIVLSLTLSVTRDRTRGASTHGTPVPEQASDHGDRCHRPWSRSHNHSINDVTAMPTAQGAGGSRAWR